MFDHKLKQALNLITGVQRMADEVLAYELEENRHRAQMPAIFSVGTFTSQTSSKALVFESKAFFVQMLETYKYWYDRAAVRIKVHNDELEPIEREVLMTVQQIIDKAMAEKD